MHTTPKSNRIRMRRWLLCSVPLLFTSCSPITKSSQLSHLAVEIGDAPRTSLDAKAEDRSAAYNAFLVGQLALHQEQFERALTNFQRASDLSQDEEAPFLHSKLAELYVRAGNLDRALEYSKQAYEEAPEDTEGTLLYAGVLEAVNRDNEARPLYEKIVTEQPDRVAPVVLLAMLYLRQDSVAEAETLLNRFLKRHPKDAAARYYFAQVLEAKGETGAAELIFAALYSEYPDNEQLAIDYVKLLLKQRKIDAAEQVCVKILERNPKHSLARRIMGQLLLSRNQLEEALPHLEALEELEQDPSETRFKIALIHIEKQNYRDAVSELQLVLAQRPEHSLARYYLASLYAGSGRRAESIDELMKIHVGDEMFVKSRLFAALVLREDGELERASDAAREALTAEPQNLHAILGTASILKARDRFEEAAAVLREGLERVGDQERLLYEYGLVLSMFGRNVEAHQVMERVIQLNPRQSDALNFVAYTLADEGRELERASNLIQQALAAKPHDPYYLDTAGWVAYKRGQFPQAREHLEQAVQLSSGDAVIQEHYGDVLRASGEADGALRSFVAALERVGAETTDEEMKRLRARLLVKIQELREALARE